jgi:Spy/CpxP family protein refolding chaperone
MVKTWQVILATIAIFVAGLVTGGATALGLERWVSSQHRANVLMMAPMGMHPGPGGPPQFGTQLMRRYADTLNLTDDQRAKIGPIVRRTAAQLSRNRIEIQQETSLAIEKMQDEIAPLLTPEQRTKFEEIISQQRNRFRQFRQNPPPPPGGEGPATGAQEPPK